MLYIVNLDPIVSVFHIQFCMENILVQNAIKHGKKTVLKWLDVIVKNHVKNMSGILCETISILWSIKSGVEANRE